VTSEPVVSHHKFLKSRCYATVKVGQFPIFRWSNVIIPVLVDDVFWFGVSVKFHEQSAEIGTDDSTALCEGNITIGDDGGFPQRIDV
jgi:hypothetical protein